MMPRSQQTLALVVLLLAPVSLFGQHFTLTPRNLLTGRFDSASVARSLVSSTDWKPYPTVDDRIAWNQIPESVRSAHIASADSLLGASWTSLSATAFLEFERTGSRTNYQKLRSSRREQLAKLVLGEVMQDEGRFLDDIVNGIWAISEETYWGVPAHLDLQSSGFGLPDADEPTVDLFAAETGALIAWTLYLLEERLDQVSPMVRPRMRSELQRRVLEPNLRRYDFWWMAFDPSVINNWNPWVNSNWLAVALIVEEDSSRRAATVYKIMRSLDVFLNSYPDDGGCDEGPAYWTRSGGSLIEVLELLRAATGGYVDIYDEPLIQEMGRYIIRAHVAGDYYVNFADARPIVLLDPAIVYRYGDRISDAPMKSFAALLAQRQNLGEGYVRGQFGYLGRQLLALFELHNLASVPPAEPLLRDVWLPDIELMTAREKAGTTDGFFLAAKGGHNAENHNHNDVGSFIVYSDGLPVLIDLGPATYTRQTFSDDRYAIWNLQSGFHNVPTANGFMQPDGPEFAAKGVRYIANDERASVRMDLAGAYPDSADIVSWDREISLVRETGVTISDRYELSSYHGQSSVTLMTNRLVQRSSDGVLALIDMTGDGAPVYIHFAGDELAATLETIALTDAGLTRTWGDNVTRIDFTPLNDRALTGQMEIAIMNYDHRN